MIHPIKIEFKDYPSGSWTDWSDYLATPPSINRKVESENDGEAGLIVFDTASVELYYTSGSPVYTAFETDLTSKQRYLFRISFYTGSTYEQLFEGMADFTTIKTPELSNVIEFDIVDKLSAMGILEASTLRNKNVDVFARSGADGVNTILQMYQPNSSGIDYMVFRMWDFDSGDQGRFINFTNTNILQLGEIFTITEDSTEKLALVIGAPEVIPEVAIDVAPPYTQYNFNSVRVKVIVSERFNYNYKVTGVLYHFTGTKLIYEKLMLGVDINIISGSILQAYDGEKIVEAIVKQQWSDITFINRTSAGPFSVPLNYFTETTGELPFNKEPLDALKMLADSMKCYIYFNRTGELVIQSKENLGTNGTTRSIGSTRKIDATKKHFWDKLIDAAEVKIKSWVQIGGEFLEGYSLQTKTAPGSSSFIKPKNKLSKELFASSSAIDTQAELDSEAATEASEYLGFYGKRRGSIDLVLELDNNVLLWDLLDNIIYNFVSYFFTSLDLDLNSKEASLELVEVTGHDYDLRSVIVPLSENQQSAITSGGTTSSGGTVFTGYTFNEPLSKLGVIVDLNYTDNFKITGGSLDTVQPIKTTSSVSFAALTLSSGNANFQLVPNDIFEYVNSADNTVWALTDLDSPGDEQFRFYGGGNTANVFSIRSDGKVGIGTESPLDRLHIKGGGISIEGTAASDLATIGYTGGNWKIDKQLFIETEYGYTKIGAGNSAWSHFYTSLPAFYFEKPISVNGTISSYNQDLVLRTTGTTRMTIKLDTGSVGIGTATPATNMTLDVNGYIKASNFETNYEQVGTLFTKVGARAFLIASTVEDSTAVGYNAGYANNGIRATFIGHYAGCNPIALGIANQAYSTAIGYYASYNTDGLAITSIGYRAGSASRGSSNSYIGYQAGEGADNTSHGDSGGNTFIGDSAGRYATTYRSVLLGSSAGYQSNMTYCVSIGFAAGQYSTDNNSVQIGYYAGQGHTATANVNIGYQTRTTFATGKLANYNTFIGYRAGYDFENLSSGVSNDTHLIGIGTYALRNSKERLIIGIGYYAGYQTTGGYSIFIGSSAGYQANPNNANAYQIGIGYQSLYQATGIYTVAVGDYAGKSSAGTNSTFIGYSAGLTSNTGQSVGIGSYALRNCSASIVTAVGYGAGDGSSAHSSMYLGYYAGQNNTTDRMFQIKNNQTTALMTGDLGNNRLAINSNTAPTSAMLQLNGGDFQQVGNSSYYNNFTSGWTGSGFRLDYGVTNGGVSTLEIDDLWIRKTAHIYELLIQQIRATNGSVFVTAAGRVENVVSANVVELEDVTGHGIAPLLEDDLIIVQRVRLDSTTLVKLLVRKVTAVNGLEITMTAAQGGPTDTGSFEVGDDIIRFGNQYNTSRQGSLYLTSDDSNAPYLDVIDEVNSWAAWTNKTKLKVRLGKLTGLEDDVFGTLTDYGLYAKRVFLSSGDSTGIQMKVDSDTAYFAMKQGGNTIFDFDTASATAHLAGWNVTDEKISKTVESFKFLEINSAPYIYTGYGYAPYNSDIGVTLGVIPSGQPYAGSVGLQCRDNDTARTYFTLTSSWRQIAGWTFDNQKLYSGTDIVLDGAAKKVSIKADAVKMYYTGASDYGIKDSAGKFQLGSTNQIAGWTFDTEKFSNGDVRLESSASLKGLGIKNAGDTVVKVGDFTNATESYYTQVLTMPTTWTLENNSHSSYYDITNSSSEIIISPNNSGVYTQVTIRYSMPLPIGTVAGKTVKIIVDTKQLESPDPGQIKLTGMLKLKTFDTDLHLQNMTTTVQTVGGDTYTRYTFYGSVPSDETEAEFWFYYYYNSAGVDPADVYVKFISAEMYLKSTVELNKTGFKSFSSPITSIDLTSGKAEFNVGSLKTSNSMQVGNFRLINQINLGGDGSTNQKLVLQFFNGSTWSTVGNFSETGAYTDT
jgi:hypothetical protein